MSDELDKLPEIQEKDRVGGTWMYNLFVSHTLTQVLIFTFTNIEVVYAYTVMFFLLQWVFFRRYLVLKKRDGQVAMQALLVAEAFFCCLLFAIAMPSVILLTLDVSIVTLVLAGALTLLNLLMAWFFYHKHWAEYRYFVSN